MRKGLEKYVILLDIWWFHGGADIMEFFQMLVWVFNPFEFDKSVPPSIIIPSVGYEDFPHIAPLFEVMPQLLLRGIVGESSEVKG